MSIETFDQRDLKAAMSSFCTGVAVITAMHENSPVGFACQSVVSMSLEPPYVSFSPAKTSTSWPKMRAAQHVCINILAHDQRPTCSAFAASGGDKFASVDWVAGRNGAPNLSDVLTRVEGTIEHEYDAGDHTIVLTRVTSVVSVRSADPLLFFMGAFGLGERS